LIALEMARMKGGLGTEAESERPSDFLLEPIRITDVEIRAIISRPLMRSVFRKPRAVSRAWCLSLGATESSTSRIATSSPEAAALANRSGPAAGVKSQLRDGLRAASNIGVFLDRSGQ
jgi:hypothetical protein